MPDSILQFNGEWRSYQKRILDDLDFHLRDDKLHVVAAPGAGNYRNEFLAVSYVVIKFTQTINKSIS